jgi:hypothetical protein
MQQQQQQQQQQQSKMYTRGALQALAGQNKFTQRKCVFAGRHVLIFGYPS